MRELRQRRCAARVFRPCSGPFAANAQNANLTFDRYTLPNGLEVILHPDPKNPIVRFNLTFRGGSKNEPPGRSGPSRGFSPAASRSRSPDGAAGGCFTGCDGAGNAQTTPIEVS